jgi:hypothetical protein
MRKKGEDMSQLALDFNATNRINDLGGHGILTPVDLEDLSESTQRVFNLMRDGKWHSADKICLAAGHNGIPASEGLRRMRELRALYEIDRRKVSDGRLFEYRIVGTKKW